MQKLALVNESLHFFIAMHCFFVFNDIVSIKGDFAYDYW